MVDNFKEIMEAAKNACKSTDCAECPYATGIYMEIEQDFHYFCGLRKPPSDWDTDKEGPVLRKDGKPVKEKKKQKKTRKKKVSK